MPDGWTWVHYKVLELAYDRTPLPELCGLHQYGGPDAQSVSIVPATSIEETRTALADVLRAGAVKVSRSEFAAEGALVRYIDLGDNEALAVLAHDSTWDEEGKDGWPYEVVATDRANELFASRPPELSPHRAARRVTDASGREGLVEL